MRWVSLALGAGLTAACVDGEGEDFRAGEVEAARALQFFSQRDPSWADVQLGSCGETIGSDGCAISAIAMAMRSLGADVTPKSLNAYLQGHGGYSDGCLVYWGEAADMDGAGGVQWVHGGALASPEAIRAGLDQGKRVLVKSSRFTPHWVFLAGYDGAGAAWDDFYYLDPYDLTATERRVGDGWVSPGASTRVYR
ncbi:C39 family peptidase [Nannocystis punicea]|uniref:C39 family peptidase n=1 Tax=Nannocystis punicea TaxID=2995304 RepID=A0ABY7GZR6_9BACT|nr:C39 family peptidase [Nannocystis poenicansa]WAS92481.1 C39 family peptidase [Nannocystis poenicansa]